MKGMVIHIMSHEILQEQLQIIVKDKSIQELLLYMEENSMHFFSTHHISHYYQILREVDLSSSDRMIPKLILAWLAFLCGDNARLQLILRGIDESKLSDAYESSFYYSLMALVVISPDGQKKIEYGKRSIEVLPKEDRSYYMANAKLTYGQMLSGMDQFRASVELFHDSYKLFCSIGMNFPAAVALINELLNRYKLGELNEVINESNKVLIMSASYKEEASDYWNIIHLPLGICYYEMNKPSLAILHLKLAKASIDQMNLLHMHGLVEQYLFKSYYSLHNQEGMEEIIAQATDDLEHMNYTYTGLLISMMRIMTSGGKLDPALQPDIERFEMEYIRRGEKSPLIVIETLAYLKILGFSDTITIDDMLQCLTRLRYIGMIPYIQLFLVLLAEMHFMDNDSNYAAECLKEAVSIYREHNISVSFYTLPLKSVCLLKEIDHKLYAAIVKKDNPETPTHTDPLLSEREKEILRLVAMGKSNDEISKLLYIGTGTIKWHLNHIFSKLDVKNRIQAVQAAKLNNEI